MLDIVFLLSGIGFFGLLQLYAVGLRAPAGAAAMTFDYILGAIVTAALLVYLTFALVRAERF